MMKTMLALSVVGAGAAGLMMQAQIVSPPEGSHIVNLDVVRVIINVWTPSPHVFAEEYAGASVCLSLDSAPYACWSILDMEVAPTFANVSVGEHTLEAIMADAARKAIRTSWSGVRRFRLTETDVLPITERQSASSDAGQDVAEETTPPGEVIPIPRLEIQEPREMATLGSSFEATYSIRTAEPERFEKLFRQSLACFELDGAAPCWALFAKNARPSWTWLGDGFRVVRGYLLHPDTLKPVLETTSDLRALLTHRSVTPTGEKIAEEEHYEQDFPWRRVSWSRDYYVNLADNRTQWDTPMGFPAPRREHCVPALASILLDGRSRVLPVRRPREQATLAATRFCAALAVINPNCPDALEAKIAQAATLDCDDSPLDYHQHKGGGAPPPPSAEHSKPTGDTINSADGPLVIPRSLPDNDDASKLPSVRRLLALKEAFDAGLVTQVEFEAKRANIISAM